MGSLRSPLEYETKLEVIKSLQGSLHGPKYTHLLQTAPFNVHPVQNSYHRVFPETCLPRQVSTPSILPRGLQCGSFTNSHYMGRQ